MMFNYEVELGPLPTMQIRKFLYEYYELAERSCRDIRKGMESEQLVWEAAFSCGLRPDVGFDIGLNWIELGIERYPIPCRVATSLGERTNDLQCGLHYAAASTKGAPGFEAWFEMFKQSLVIRFPNGLSSKDKARIQFWKQSFKVLLEPDHNVMLYLEACLPTETDEG